MSFDRPVVFCARCRCDTLAGGHSYAMRCLWCDQPLGKHAPEVEPEPVRQKPRKPHDREVAEVLWKDGATHAELGSALGISEDAAKQLVLRMRADGHDMPYRRADKAAA